MSIRHFFAALLATLSFAAAAAVDVNQATRADLESVKGIGPALSGKILAARDEARFKDWSDLVDRVGGLGPGNAAKLSANGLTVAGAAYGGAAAPAAADARKPTVRGDGAERSEKKTEKAEKTGRAEQKAAKGAKADNAAMN